MKIAKFAPKVGSGVIPGHRGFRQNRWKITHYVIVTKGDRVYAGRDYAHAFRLSKSINGKVEPVTR
jgi:hypothetical protein